MEEKNIVFRIEKCSILAFDIGGTKIASGLVTLPKTNGAGTTDSSDGSNRQIDKQPGVILSAKIPTLAGRGGDDIISRLVKFTQEQLRECKQCGITPDAIGIGSAGVVDSSTGTILTATNLIPGWAGQHLADALEKTTGLPVHVIGDVGAHGLGEAKYGAGRGYNSVLSVGVGTGIGGAFIEDWKLCEGSHYAAGNIGHMPHPLGLGIRCSCGAKGHIEPVASGTGLATLYNRMKDLILTDDEKNKVPALSNGKEVSDLASSGDPTAIAVIQTSAHALGECIGGACNLMDPEVVVVSGSVTQAGLLWFNPLLEGFKDSALPAIRDTPLLQGSLGNEAPLIGAAVGAIQSMCAA
ncbi:ROK family protein [Bifidobacterium sp. ESL0732]|uniref:ROK family protein n=1 Tax=Bifidobacterium sp. ESL0732 TaxID=2983222 RepID=UPI0023F66652|nr:ROK family protein [Bifidobacterium sp. ESL0732]WEV64933.1 ROK family protein [Bifidobacterium sp. ESL0732]